MSREEQNGPGFHYLVRWRDQTQQTLDDQHDVLQNNISSDHSEFKERQVAANVTELVLGGRPVFSPYDVYVVSVNDIGVAVTTPQLAVLYTGEDGRRSLYSSLSHH